MKTQAADSTESPLVFDNSYTRELPADPVSENTRRQVKGACYSRVEPTVVSAPKLVAYSREMAESLGLDAEYCESDQFAQVFAGNQLMPGMEPYANCYGGHQFGNWAGQLGDGRAISLGETVNSSGERWTLQLKGAGPTPYSRTADGLAVLRSSVREFLCSEAMYHLGVPTTRALSLVLTGEYVVRDMFYDGNARPEPGAIVCRTSPSFTRFGNFEILSARGEIELLRQLADYTIKTDFPHLREPSVDTYLSWFEEVCRRTAEMVVHWQRVGFVHGVMNTDNMSILGLTIDYGPYGWLEDYDPDWTPNTTDAGGRRYRFGNQPQIALWNLVQLANAIYPLIEDVPALENVLEVYKHEFESGRNRMMAEKLGLQDWKQDTDSELVKELYAVLQLVETDMTIFYRALADLKTDNIDATNDDLLSVFSEAYYLPDQLTAEYNERAGAWVRRYIQRVRLDGHADESRAEQMNKVNPLYVMRNYIAQLAIDAAEQGDFSLVNETLDVMRTPYDKQAGKEKFAGKRPDWARNRPGCSMLSCSS